MANIREFKVGDKYRSTVSERTFTIVSVKPLKIEVERVFVTRDGEKELRVIEREVSDEAKRHLLNAYTKVSK